jgi:hypothetical protein
MMNARTKASLQRILDCMSGSDTSYVSLMWVLDDLDEQAANGDQAATELVNVVHKFARLIDVSEKIVKEKQGRK